MANQSQKANQKAIRGKMQIIHYALYPLFSIFLLLNMLFLITESISFWHFLFCLFVAAISHLCIKQTVKSWQLQLPSEAYEYYIDILGLNSVVALIDPITHSIWHIYWLILVFILYKLGGYLWDYITPKYEETEDQGKGKKDKKDKKEKKEKVKYVRY